MNAANDNPLLNQIVFNFGGGGGGKAVGATYVIVPENPLPDLTDDVEINCLTFETPGPVEAGAALPLPDCTDDIPDRTYAIVIPGGAGSGFHIVGPGGDGTTIKGLVTNDWSEHGIFVDAADKVKIQCNHIGTDASGELSVPNDLDGVHILDAQKTRV